MNTPTVPASVDSSNTWGKTPVNPIQITQAFSNDPNDLVFQDVGFDGIDDIAERRKKNYILQQLANNFGPASAVYQCAFQDPSNDNYQWYRDPAFDAVGLQPNVLVHDQVLCPELTVELLVPSIRTPPFE